MLSLLYRGSLSYHFFVHLARKIENWQQLPFLWALNGRRQDPKQNL